MKLISIVLAIILSVKIVHASQYQASDDLLSLPWSAKSDTTGCIITKEKDGISYSHPSLFSTFSVNSIKADQITFRKDKPHAGTAPVQDITITSSMTYREFICAVFNVFGGVKDPSHIMYAMSIGALYGATFEFENGNTITLAHHFIAYQTQHCGDSQGPEFEFLPKNEFVGEKKLTFSQLVKPAFRNFVSKNPRPFMGFYPHETGVIDTTMNLEDLTKELAKLGKITNLSRDQKTIDQKYPEVFKQFYRLINANYDEFMRRKSHTFIIP